MHQDGAVRAIRRNESNTIKASFELADSYSKNASARRDRNDLLSSATVRDGYYYKVLGGRASAASEESDGNIVSGTVAEDIAVIVYPASHGISGFMTFAIDHDGAIYEKDLGPRTVLAVLDLTATDRTWRRLP